MPTCSSIWHKLGEKELSRVKITFISTKLDPQILISLTHQSLRLFEKIHGSQEKEIHSVQVALGSTQSTFPLGALCSVQEARLSMQIISP